MTNAYKHLIKIIACFVLSERHHFLTYKGKNLDLQNDQMKIKVVI